VLRACGRARRTGGLGWGYNTRQLGCSARALVVARPGAFPPSSAPGAADVAWGPASSPRAFAASLRAARLNEDARRFPNKIINLHPALPGEYPGTHSIDRAFADFQSGARRWQQLQHTHVHPRTCTPARADPHVQTHRPLRLSSAGGQSTAQCAPRSANAAPHASHAQRPPHSHASTDAKEHLGVLNRPSTLNTQPSTLGLSPLTPLPSPLPSSVRRGRPHAPVSWSTTSCRKSMLARFARLPRSGPAPPSYSLRRSGCSTAAWGRHRPGTAGPCGHARSALLQCWPR
jgi:hypothetical protein